MIGGVLLGHICGVLSSSSSVVDTRVHSNSPGSSSRIDCNARSGLHVRVVLHSTIYWLVHHVLAVGCRAWHKNTTQVKPSVYDKTYLPLCYVRLSGCLTQNECIHIQGSLTEHHKFELCKVHRCETSDNKFKINSKMHTLVHANSCKLLVRL